MGTSSGPGTGNELAPAKSEGGVATRIDPPHGMPGRTSEPMASTARGSDSAEPAARAIASPTLANALAQFRLQARQLAEALRARQQELDRREAREKAQLAQFEQEVRSAKLWWSERSAELAAREQAIVEREGRLASLVARCETQAQGLGTFFSLKSR